jgi:DNA polymerase I-like protein with 3'-5' exonuclease and polymerase domains
MSRIKECFTSRFNDGVIMEADYSQLEVICLAFLSNDLVLRQDILEGIDLHSMSAASLYKHSYMEVRQGYVEGDPVMTKKRKISKAFSFQLQYGSGAAAMAASIGEDISVAKEFIAAYYARYSGVKAYQDMVASTVKKSRVPSKRRTASGLPAGVGHYSSITGRRYVFQEYDAPDWMVAKGIKTSFSPTQMKNYPTQGFATGDIVPLILGEVYEELKRNPFLVTKALLVNTVHDSIVLDVHPGCVNQTASLVKGVMENAPLYIRKTWGFDFDLPLSVGISTGPSWANQSEYKLV